MAGRGRSGDGDTKAAIMDVAERLVQARGFNAFSYGDVAAEVGITKAALHYHFAGKAELGEELIERYAARFAEALDAIDAAVGDAPAKLRAYADLYLDVLRRDRLCLCGMLAADVGTLPDSMRARITRFFDDNEVWVAGVLTEGLRAGTLELTARPDETARLFIGALEGAMLIARPYHEPERFRAMADTLVASLSPLPGGSSRPRVAGAAPGWGAEGPGRPTPGRTPGRSR